MSDFETETIPRPKQPPATNGSEQPNLLKSVGGPNAQRYGVGARARLAVTQRVRNSRAWITARWRRVRGEVAKPAEKHSGTFLWGDPAESLAEHWGYIRAGGWSDVPLLIIVGRMYGLLVFPVCAASLAGTWILRRPTRLLVACVVVAICWATV